MRELQLVDFFLKMGHLLDERFLIPLEGCAKGLYTSLLLQSSVLGSLHLGAQHLRFWDALFGRLPRHKLEGVEHILMFRALLVVTAMRFLNPHSP